jgi:hypothetical protein
MTEVRDTSDPRQVEKALKAAKTKDDLRAEGLLQLMKSTQGRAWLFHLIELCGPGQNPFTSDALRTAFNCGELNIGNQLVAQCHACSLELYLQMMKENQDV